jgi:hypothetical protein
MTGLWTNDHDTLADGLMELDWVQWAASRLISTGVVRVLDPDNTELRYLIAKAIWGPTGEPAPICFKQADDVIVALRQP